MEASREIRAATGDDVAAIRAILAAHDTGPPDAADRDEVAGYVTHLVAHHRVLVAVDDESVVGFGATVETGRCTMLSDLFVLPDRLGTGVGGALLPALFGNASRRATFASADPRALPLYVRAGMAPMWVDLYLEGQSDALPDPGPGVAIRIAVPGEPASLEMAWTGADRGADLAFLASLDGADAFVVDDAEGPVAVGSARTRAVGAGRELDRLVVRPGADPVPGILAALVRAGRGGTLLACVPGPNPILPILLDARFRIVDQDQYLASDPDIVDPARLLPNPGML